MSDIEHIREVVHSESQLDSIVSWSADAIITIDDQLHIRSWNRGAQDIYGYAAEEAIGQHITLLIPRDLQEQGELDHILETVKREGSIQNFETVRLTRSNQRIHVAFTATRLMDTEGEPTGFISVIVRDISEKKELEQRLERKISGLFIINEIGRALQGTTDLDEILHIVLVGVTAGQALRFNRAFLFLLNESKTHLEGRMAIGPSSPEEAGRIWTELGDKWLSLNDILRSHLEEKADHDTLINQMVRKISIPVTDTSHILIQTLDTRASSNVSEAEYKAESPPAFLDVIDASSFAVVPLFSQEQSQGVLLADNLITGRPILEEDVELLEIFAQQASATIENSFLYQKLARQVRELEEANNNLKLYQEKLIHAERLSAIGEMAATVAHEIRNPLVSIGGFARALGREFPEDAPQQESLNIIIKEGMRLEGIVTDVLNLARPMHDKNEPHAMNPLIQDALRMVRGDLDANQIQLEERLREDLPLVPMHPDHIKQVLLNLIKNAVDVMQTGGRLSVWTDIPNPAYIEVGIADTGPGISEESLEKIFNAFFTTKPGGSGLGLTVAYRIVHDHGGKLDVSSTSGEGTTFIMQLPMEQRLVLSDSTVLNTHRQ